MWHDSFLCVAQCLRMRQACFRDAICIDDSKYNSAQKIQLWYDSFLRVAWCLGVWQACFRDTMCILFGLATANNISTTLTRRCVWHVCCYVCARACLVRGVYACVCVCVDSKQYLDDPCTQVCVACVLLCVCVCVCFVCGVCVCVCWCEWWQQTISREPLPSGVCDTCMISVWFMCGACFLFWCVWMCVCVCVYVCVRVLIANTVLMPLTPRCM